MRDLPPPYITNERYKSIARSLFQLGSALLGATAVRLYSTLTFDLTLVIWAFGAAGLTWAGWVALGLLESEKEA